MYLFKGDVFEDNFGALSDYLHVPFDPLLRQSIHHDFGEVILRKIYKKDFSLS